VDAFPGETYNGQVVQIRKAATVVQNVVTYTVVISVGNPGGRLLPGMTANVKTVVAEKPNVLKVSNAALRYRPAGADPGPGPAVGGPRSGPGGPPQPASRDERRSPGGGGGRQSLESIRERLVISLKLTAEQQAKLDPILAESREQIRGLQGLGEGERRARAQEIREATRNRIREILTPEQRARYEQDAAGVPNTGGDGAGTGVQGRVWVLGPDGKPKPLTLVLGITDGTATEVLRGDLQEGQEVIVGTAAQGGRPGQAPGGASPPRLRL
jgi:HlyD family secretion protein